MPVIQSELKDEILINKYRHFIDKVKYPLRAAVVLYGRRYPEPTRENIKNPDSLVLFDIWEEFFELEDNPGRDPFFKALRRITIGEIESNDYYAQRVTWWLMKLAQAYIDGRWQPNLPCCPFANWKDPATIEAKDKAIEDILTKWEKPFLVDILLTGTKAFLGGKDDLSV